MSKIGSLERVNVTSKIGSRGPVRPTGLGKALLAGSVDEVVERDIVKATTGRGVNQLTDPEGFREVIASRRLRSHSIDHKEDATGGRCQGVAVRGEDSAPFLAFSLTGPLARFTLERVIAAAPRRVERETPFSRVRHRARKRLDSWLSCGFARGAFMSYLRWAQVTLNHQDRPDLRKDDAWDG